MLETTECCLDFAKLNAVPPTLDLSIGSSDEIDKTVRTDLREISCPVDTAAALWSLEKCRPGLWLILPVSRAQADTSDIEFADGVLRNHSKRFVQDQQGFT